MGNLNRMERVNIMVSGYVEARVLASTINGLTQMATLGCLYRVRETRVKTLVFFCKAF